MNARDRFNAVLAFEKPDRLPFMEYMFYWPETRERWEQEGMPKNVDPTTYFGYDRFDMLPVNWDVYPPGEVEVLDEDSDSRTVRDAVGVIKREFKHGSAMPHYIRFPIESRDDFLQLRERLDPKSPGRYPPDWDEQVKTLRTRDYPVGMVTRGLLAFMRDLMKFEHMALTFRREPAWVDEMMSFHTRFIMDVWERALSQVEVDFVQLGEDMAYKNGPMISPRMVERYMLPHYHVLTDFLRQHGVRSIIVDSDGDIRTLIPLFLEGGITCVLPMENNANCNPVDVREAFPHIAMIGGIDKIAVAQGGGVMEREVRRKLEQLGPTSGYIPSFDHSVHPAVSLDTYRKYLRLLRELCESAV